MQAIDTEGKFGKLICERKLDIASRVRKETKKTFVLYLWQYHDAELELLYDEFKCHALTFG